MSDENVAAMEARLKELKELAAMEQRLAGLKASKPKVRGNKSKIRSSTPKPALIMPATIGVIACVVGAGYFFMSSGDQHQIVAANSVHKHLAGRSITPATKRLVDGKHCSVVSKLLGPSTDLSTFYESHYERTWLHVPGNRRESFRESGLSVTSKDIFSTLLRDQNNHQDQPSPIAYGEIFALSRVVGPQNSETYYPPYKYEDNWMELTKKLPDVMLDGYSLIVNSMQSRLKPILELCKPLSMAHGRRCDVNAYISNAAKQGFKVHFDTQDTFILQMEGSKEWDMWRPARLPLDLPLPDDDMAFEIGVEDVDRLGEPDEKAS
jgi:hypothetical protein